MMLAFIRCAVLGDAVETAETPGRFRKAQMGWRQKCRQPMASESNLLNFDLGAGFFQLLLQGFSVSLGDAFLHSLGSAVDDVLGFL